MTNFKNENHIGLSKYHELKVSEWNNIEKANIIKLIRYIEQNIDIDLKQKANTENELEIYAKLHVWLFNFYHQTFINGLNFINYDLLSYKRNLIYSFILSITRNRPNIDILYNVLRSKGIIDKMIIHEDFTYEIITYDFQTIKFKPASNIIDLKTKEYLSSLKERVIDSCHEISLYLIESHSDLRAITSICTKGLNGQYYHSFVTDEQNNVIDLTANLIMPLDDYYMLQNVEELNNINYEEYLEEEKETIALDESKTLYGLLRNALYKQISAEKNITL